MAFILRNYKAVIAIAIAFLGYIIQPIVASLWVAFVTTREVGAKVVKLEAKQEVFQEYIIRTDEKYKTIIEKLDELKKSRQKRIDEKR